MGSAGAGGVFAFLLVDTGFAALLLARGFGLLDRVAGFEELALPGAASPGLDAAFLRSKTRPHVGSHVNARHWRI